VGHAAREARAVGDDDQPLAALGSNATATASPSRAPRRRAGPALMPGRWPQSPHRHPHGLLRFSYRLSDPEGDIALVRRHAAPGQAQHCPQNHLVEAHDGDPTPILNVRTEKGERASHRDRHPLVRRAAGSMPPPCHDAASASPRVERRWALEPGSARCARRCRRRGSTWSSRAEGEQSASSHALSLRRPLRLRSVFGGLRA
jgi:hypothetical protein